MPSLKMKAGDTGYVRMKVLEAGADYFQIVVEGRIMTVTLWVPADECALYQDIGELRPPRRANPAHIER
ncbi:hypothetical protein [Bradyrhizobium roseum]|uniref:hypothetical protein n=1 Tax=Bradyrhizobium roseum TaxID=3056648 RepID=UPI00261FEA7E|nr:hypothetical protein [Bradyrhizobium roseus]WKA31585.1 hypothetical protein QUH67_16120 [Bradyrhizobium roseus]